MTTAEAAQGEQFDSSAEERITLWEDALNVIRQNPISGTGFNTYSYMGRVGQYRDTHNYYLKILLETGFAGLVLYLVLLWKLLRTGTALLYKTEDAFWRSIGLGFVALLASAIVMNFFGDRWTYQQVDGYLWVFLGMAIRGLVVSQEIPEQSSTTAASGEAIMENSALVP